MQPRRLDLPCGEMVAILSSKHRLQRKGSVLSCAETGAQHSLCAYGVLSTQTNAVRRVIRFIYIFHGRQPYTRT